MMGGYDRGLPVLGRPEERPHFKTKIGLVLSCLGCVVGTGNIWRFPRIVANNSDEEGGLVFLLVWIFFLFLWSIPMLLIEYGTGRFCRKAIIGSFRHLVGDNSAWCGAWISMVSFLISCYYSVVLGWCFYYVYHTIAYELPETDKESREIFREYAEDSYWPILTHSIAVLITGFSVIKGVKTIEKVNLVLVPLLLLIVLFTFTWSLTRKYADHGIRFLFTPHWESFGEPRVWVDAISQNAFDTGAGVGVFIPYASYMTVDNHIVKYGLSIPMMNNFVSLSCGIMVFSTVFSTIIMSNPTITQPQILKILKDSGPASTGLTFIWIPVLYSTIGSFGRVLAVLFFLCLSFAGTTSLISNMELVTHTFTDFGVPRNIAMVITVLLTFCGGLASALDIEVLTNQDFVWGFALLINGLMLQSMVIRYGTAKFRHDAFNGYSIGDWKLPVIWEWVVKIIAPLEAVAIIGWWAYDLIDGQTEDGEEWYEFGTETFLMTIVQWGALMVLVILINVLSVCCKRDKLDAETVKLLRNDPMEQSREASYATLDSIDRERQQLIDQGSYKEIRL